MLKNRGSVGGRWGKCEIRGASITEETPERVPDGWMYHMLPSFRVCFFYTKNIR